MHRSGHWNKVYGMKGKGKREAGRGPKRLFFNSKAHRVMRDFIYRREEERIKWGVRVCGMETEHTPHT